MDDGWIIGGRYENVSIVYGGTHHSNYITESSSSTFRATSTSYRINVNGQLVESDGDLVSVNWDTNDQVIAISPWQYNGAQCVILESGSLRCWALIIMVNLVMGQPPTRTFKIL